MKKKKVIEPEVKEKTFDEIALEECLQIIETYRQASLEMSDGSVEEQQKLDREIAELQKVIKKIQKRIDNPYA